MVCKCCVPGCRGNYTKAQSERTFVFPTDEPRRSLWIQAVGRKNFVPTPNTRVCRRHFDRHQFKYIDYAIRPETGEVLWAKLKLPSLLRTAVPHIFPNPSLDYLVAAADGKPYTPCRKTEYTSNSVQEAYEELHRLMESEEEESTKKTSAVNMEDSGFHVDGVYAEMIIEVDECPTSPVKNFYEIPHESKGENTNKTSKEGNSGKASKGDNSSKSSKEESSNKSSIEESSNKSSKEDSENNLDSNSTDKDSNKKDAKILPKRGRPFKSKTKRLKMDYSEEIIELPKRRTRKSMMIEEVSTEAYIETTPLREKRGRLSKALIYPTKEVLVTRGNKESSCKLVSIPRVRQSIKHTPLVALQLLFRVMYYDVLPEDAEELRHEILAFNGFSIKRNSSDFAKRSSVLTECSTLDDLQNICRLLGIKIHPPQDELVENILNYLMHPTKELDPSLDLMYQPTVRLRKFNIGHIQCVKKWEGPIEKRRRGRPGPKKKQKAQIMTESPVTKTTRRSRAPTPPPPVTVTKKKVKTVELPVKEVEPPPQSVKRKRETDSEIEEDAREPIVKKIKKQRPLHYKKKSWKLDDESSENVDTPSRVKRRSLKPKHYGDWVIEKTSESTDTASETTSTPSISSSSSSTETSDSTTDSSNCPEDKLKKEKSIKTPNKAFEKYILGEGRRLGSFPQIARNVSMATACILQRLHVILFGTSLEPEVMKRNILNFKGFPFDKSSDEWSQKHFFLSLSASNNLLEVFDVLHVEVADKSPAKLVDALMNFLLAPCIDKIKKEEIISIPKKVVVQIPKKEKPPPKPRQKKFIKPVLPKNRRKKELMDEEEVKQLVMEIERDQRARKREEARRFITPPNAAPIQPVIVPLPEKPDLDMSEMFIPDVTMVDSKFKLDDNPHIRFLIVALSYEDLDILHNLLYLSSSSKARVRRNILNFEGFKFDETNTRYEVRMTILRRLGHAMVKRIAFILGLAPLNTTLNLDILVELIMEFLVSPSQKKQIPIKRFPENFLSECPCAFNKKEIYKDIPGLGKVLALEIGKFDLSNVVVKSKPVKAKLKSLSPKTTMPTLKGMPGTFVAVKSGEGKNEEYHIIPQSMSDYDAGVVPSSPQTVTKSFLPSPGGIIRQGNATQVEKNVLVNSSLLKSVLPPGQTFLIDPNKMIMMTKGTSKNTAVLPGAKLPTGSPSAKKSFGGSGLQLPAAQQASITSLMKPNTPVKSVAVPSSLSSSLVVEQSKTPVNPSAVPKLIVPSGGAGVAQQPTFLIPSGLMGQSGQPTFFLQSMGSSQSPFLIPVSTGTGDQQTFVLMSATSPNVPQLASKMILTNPPVTTSVSSSTSTSEILSSTPTTVTAAAATASTSSTGSSSTAVSAAITPGDKLTVVNLPPGRSLLSQQQIIQSSAFIRSELSKGTGKKLIAIAPEGQQSGKKSASIVQLEQQTDDSDMSGVKERELAEDSRSPVLVTLDDDTEEEEEEGEEEGGVSSENETEEVIIPDDRSFDLLNLHDTRELLPSNAVLFTEIRRIIDGSDLTVLSLKKICEKLREYYPGLDIVARRPFITKSVKNIICGEASMN